MSDTEVVGTVEAAGGEDAGIAELMVEAAELRRLVGELREQLAATEATAAELRQQRDEAVARYRERLIASAPAVPPELIRGATAAELEASLAAALELVDRVRRQLLEQARQGRVPAGAPVRSGVDVGAMSPPEKIAYALGREAR